METESPNSQRRFWTEVTPFSKYAAMAVFIIFPFVGGYIGYHLAPIPKCVSITGTGGTSQDMDTSRDTSQTQEQIPASAPSATSRVSGNPHNLFYLTTDPSRTITPTYFPDAQPLYIAKLVNTPASLSQLDGDDSTVLRRIADTDTYAVFEIAYLEGNGYGLFKLHKASGELSEMAVSQYHVQGEIGGGVTSPNQRMFLQAEIATFDRDEQDKWVLKGAPEKIRVLDFDSDTARVVYTQTDPTKRLVGLCELACPREIYWVDDTHIRVGLYPALTPDEYATKESNVIETIDVSL